MLFSHNLNTQFYSKPVSLPPSRSSTLLPLLDFSIADITTFPLSLDPGPHDFIPSYSQLVPHQHADTYTQSPSLSHSLRTRHMPLVIVPNLSHQPLPHFRIAPAPMSTLRYLLPLPLVNRPPPPHRPNPKC